MHVNGTPYCRECKYMKVHHGNSSYYYCDHENRKNNKSNRISADHLLRGNAIWCPLMLESIMQTPFRIPTFKDK